MEPYLTALIPVLMYSSIPGCLGGLVSFLWAYRQGLIRKNKYFAKLSIELFGAGILASFVGPLLGHRTYLAFAVGLAWAQIMEILRVRITSIVEAAIGKGAN